MDPLIFCADVDMVRLCLNVSTRQEHHKYECNINDFNSCQYPKPVLTKEACFEIIYHKIRNNICTYEVVGNAINVRIDFMQGYNIKFTLNKVASVINNSNTILSHPNLLRLAKKSKKPS